MSPRHTIFLRAWRKHRGYTLERLADAVGTTHATLSRIERGLMPYNQDFLERVAAALGCAPADLLIRDLADSEGIWSIWNRATPTRRRQIVEIAKALMKSSNG